MVRLTVTLVASQPGAGPMLDALRSLLVSTRLARGCLGCQAWREADDETTLHYAEEWATESDVRRRVLSNRFTSLLAVMEAAIEPPRIRFDFITMTRGLDYVEEVRHETAGGARRM